ncbi:MULTISPECIES: NACHT domain-containing protein [unclassified Microcoleus]|uniref:NACHT C-terminal alpha/beta 1 domain-containing protein n=1 Tax=unclassified Microcoleus TaxID=2642155 RepID=UPI002FD6370C
MSRNSGWGEAEQKNSLNFVEALLSHADEALELDNALKTAVQVEWVSANQLRVTGKEKQKTGKRTVEVGTRKEHLVALIKKTGKPLEIGKRQGSQQDKELDAIQTVLDCLRELGVLKEDPNPRKNQGYWKFTLTLQHQTASRDKNLAVIKQKWQDKTASNIPESSPIPDKNIDWRDICDKVVATQQLRRQATAQQYELNIYVPLGLMERPKTPNPIPNPTGEESRQKEPEPQIVEKYKDDAFFQKVITENRTEKGKHIAIIGEPGAGKTTLLGELAERLPKSSPDFPICIRLADLRESTIEDYLLDNWLKKALQFINSDAENVTPEIKKALKQLFCQGKVWLLLDAVDEMAAASPVQALAKIREQLTDWVGKARVVLTCRLNVWDATISNTLTNFETYKTLEFEPDDVDEFIRQWFEQAIQDEKRRNSGNESFWQSQGKRLQQQLKEAGKERIRELVRNPLRLSMLCQSWCVAERDLPSTKAALYEQFTTYFFEWKQEEFQKKHRVLKETDKKQIQQALAKLALAAMESANRFRIEQEFAIGQMEEQWFDLADELGWLVLVDRDTRRKKPVYSFLHSSFQEYFAASAIYHWDFFLPSQHKDKPVAGKYRIFEPQWKEVVLLWLGREEIAQYQKEELIKTLLNFEDGCGKFYLHLARLLIFDYLYEFGYLNKVSIEAFIDCELTKNLDTFLRLPAKYIKTLLTLYKYGPVGSLNFDLREWLNSMPEVFLIEEEVNMRLGDLTFLSMPESFLIEREMSLDQDYLIINALKQINSTDDINSLIQYLNIESQHNICITKCGNNLEENMIVLEIEFNEEAEQDSDIRREAMLKLIEISRNDPMPVAAAASLAIYTSQNSHTRRLLTWLLGEIAPGNLTVLNSLVYLLQTSQDKLTRVGAIDSLHKVIKRGGLLQAMVEKLKNNLTYQVYKNDSALYNECFRILLYYTQTISYPDFYQAWHKDTPTNSATASLNLANLPQILAAAINNQPDLCSKVKLICIDTHQFIDPENPAPEIYDEMLNQNCPESQNGYPDTMQKLKLYWNSLRRQSEIPLFFICYDSTALSPTPTGVSAPFLKALSKFDRTICVVCEKGDISLPTFSPSQPDLIEEIVKFLRARIS